MTDRETHAMCEELQIATAYPNWHYNEAGECFETGPLSKALADMIARDFTSLDCPVSICEADGHRTCISVMRGHAADWLVAESHDRSHAPKAPQDNLLTHLRQHHPQFVWQVREGGYVGSGYNLTSEGKLLQPFRDAGIEPEQTRVPTNHDEETHGIFLAGHQVKALIEHERQTQR